MDKNTQLTDYDLKIPAVMMRGGISKIAVVNRSTDVDADIAFLCTDAAIDEPRIDYAGSSGNSISAVGLFALEESWLRPIAPSPRCGFATLISK